jgi:hypothetical protein
MHSLKIANVKRRMYRSVPLIPVYCSFFIFTAVLSPIFWSLGIESYSFLFIVAGLSVTCAYSTTVFVDEIIKNKNQ